MTKIGEPVRRVEDERFLTGRGRYVDDIQLQGQVAAVFVRSPHAHADIIAIDRAAAADAPGVLAVLINADLVADGISPIPCAVTIKSRDGQSCFVPPRWPLAQERVRHVGDPVAIVIAETEGQARDAADLVQVEYAPLPAITNTARALDAGIPQLWDEAPQNICIDWDIGDPTAVETAFKGAAHVTEITDLINNRLAVASMEGRAAAGEYDATTGRYTLHVTCPFVHNLRRQLAEQVLHISEEDLRVIAPDIGAGFGMKNFACPEYPLVLWAARRLGRPVKWTSSRSEAFMSDDQARDHASTAQMALDREGRILGLRIHTIATHGAYLVGASAMLPTTANASAASGVYDIPAAHLEVKTVFTNKTPTGSYRGVGRAEAIYVIERLIDKAADETGIDAAELRRRNLIPATAMPYTTPFGFTFDSGDFPGTFEGVLAGADYAGFEGRRAESDSRGRLRGIGIAYYIDDTLGPAEEGADIRFGEDDFVTLLVGTFNNGQGLETTLRQIVSDQLGVPFDRIGFEQGDTDKLAIGGGHGGSRSTEMGGSALRAAADRVIEKGRMVAAHELEAADADIEFTEGRFVVAGTDRALGLSEVAAIARDPARRPDGLDEDLDTHERYLRRASAWPNGCHVVEVEIDPETGHVTVLRYTVVNDFGNIINPLIVTGMVHGGIAQGAGQALFEDMIYDDESGQLLTGSFMDYTLPKADDLCDVTLSFNEIPTETNPLGVKGCGEADTIGAHPAIMNAVIDALSARGITELDCPATPQRVWRAIRGR
jgi:carbon-monoxide dehydrogenase large subunit